MPLRRIPDERGTIFHMLRADDPHFVAFGEIYFTSVYEGIVKGWHRHRDMTLNYACIHGRVKLVLYDDRERSPNRRRPDGALPRARSPRARRHPTRHLDGLKGMTSPFALVANCATHPHDAAQTTRLDPFDNDIPYDWAVRHH